MVISTYFFPIKVTDANAVDELLFTVRAHSEVQAGGIDHREVLEWSQCSL
jgi:hypothetical protein